MSIPRPELRGAVVNANGQQLVALLLDVPLPLDALQLIGDGLLQAMAQDIADADTLAAKTAQALRERGIAGDRLLAAELDIARGVLQPNELRPVPVNLEELSMHLEGDQPYEAVLNEETGALMFSDPMLTGIEVPEDEPWLPIHSLGSRPGWRDMAHFTQDFDGNPQLIKQLQRVLDGRRSFRRFKDTLHRHPAALESWYAYSDERARGRAREWMADEGLKPILHRPKRAVPLTTA